jgi:hypothetical protein
MDSLGKRKYTFKTYYLSELSILVLQPEDGPVVDLQLTVSRVERVVGVEVGVSWQTQGQVHVQREALLRAFNERQQMLVHFGDPRPLEV